jgi:hypothetical protein
MIPAATRSVTTERVERELGDTELLGAELHEDGHRREEKARDEHPGRGHGRLALCHSRADGNPVMPTALLALLQFFLALTWIVYVIYLPRSPRRRASTSATCR